MNPKKQLTASDPNAHTLQQTVRARNASQTRLRILSAARRCFSCKSYENVGIREIAAEAGVDAALVSRYFGGKEQLFAEIIQGAFNVEEHLPTDLNGIGAFLVEQVLNDEPTPEDDGFNPLSLLLLAAASPETSTVVSNRFQKEFVQPLAQTLGGRNANVRAALIGSYVIGLATMRHLLKSPDLAPPLLDESVTLVINAIQSCVAHPPESDGNFDNVASKTRN
ncbi:TetR family transcriptional regulator [Pseudomonas sp. NA-150]|uniref:TetR/AcrR family transcriptional regulator n=1 Tax=Pseudomonas sp. NA-150 TaxID=3367525 RepID=UPI0037C739AC